MDYTAYEKNHWYKIKQVNDLRYHWRISDDRVYEVVCELFANKEQALVAAKSIYVTMLYNLLNKEIGIENAGCEFYARSLFIPGMDGNIEDYPESSFYWTPKRQGGDIGPGVYEVPESFEDYDRVYGDTLREEIDSAYIDIPVLDFQNYDTSPFEFSKKIQPMLYTIVQAEAVFGIGLRMTLYCGLLEHMAEDQLKQPEIISEIDLLIKHVNSSCLPSEDKRTLASFIGLAKYLSAKQKCLLLCEKYAKEEYGGVSTKEIFNDAYSIRSSFSHGDECNGRYSGPGSYIKFVVLDVLAGYAKDHVGEEIDF